VRNIQVIWASHFKHGQSALPADIFPAPPAVGKFPGTRIQLTHVNADYATGKNSAAAI
jgi:hypothetical protein